jgi:hypothetical protein
VNAAAETRASVSREHAGSIRRLFAHAILQDAPLLIVITSFAATALVLHAVTGVPQTVDFFLSVPSLLSQSLLYAIVALIVVLVRAVVLRGMSLVSPAAWRHIASTLFDPAILLNYAVVFVSLQFLMQAFVAFKASIPIFHPFSWDIAFMEGDRLLHFGYHPFALLQPLLGTPTVTMAVDYVYFLWISVMWLTAIWQAWHGSRETPFRSQFLLSFALCWIVIGTIMATYLSSAGPAYYGAVTGAPNPFVPLMDYLHTVNAQYPLRAIRLQELLWTAYQDPEMAGLGISAMPSMHVAIAVLMALLGFSVRRWIGWAYSVFAVAILLGSIHLGWHYAIDGYLAGVVTVGIWWLSGRVMRWWRGVERSGYWMVSGSNSIS